MNKVGKYSYKSLRNTKPRHPSQTPPEQTQPTANYNRQQPRRPPQEKTCYNCGNKFKGNPIIHLQSSCPAKEVTCPSCNRTGHFAKFCNSNGVKQITEEEPNNVANGDEDNLYSINLFRIETTSKANLHDFKAQVAINNSIDSVIADTGAKVSVCSSHHAKKWGIWKKMIPSKTQIKPYNSKPIPVAGVARCSVTFGRRSTPVIWHIINATCEPILGGNSAIQLGILKFTQHPDAFVPINLIHSECQPNMKNELQKILAEHNDTFSKTRIGKVKDYKVVFCENKNVKPDKERKKRKTL